MQNDVTQIENPIISSKIEDYILKLIILLVHFRMKCFFYHLINNLKKY